MTDHITFGIISAAIPAWGNTTINTTRNTTMSKEPAIDARVIGATVKIEVCRKVERKYRHDVKDSMSTIYARALEDSVRDVALTARDYRAIAAEMAANQAKREAKRARNGGLR